RGKLPRGVTGITSHCSQWLAGRPRLVGEVRLRGVDVPYETYEPPQFVDRWLMAEKTGRERDRRADGDHVRLLPSANCVSVRSEPPTWVDRRGRCPLLGMAGALGGGVHPVGQGRDPVRHRLRTRFSKGSPYVYVDFQPGAGRAVRGLAAGGLGLRAFHEA